LALARARLFHVLILEVPDISFARQRDSVSTEAATSSFRSGRFIVRLANGSPLSYAAPQRGYDMSRANFKRKGLQPRVEEWRRDSSSGKLAGSLKGDSKLVCVTDVNKLLDARERRSSERRRVRC
jgi:hypothetical protein